MSQHLMKVRSLMSSALAPRNSSTCFQHQRIAKSAPIILFRRPVSSRALKSSSNAASARSQLMYNALAKSLASRSSPTLLYQATLPGLYMTLNYVLGGACFFYSGWHIYNTFLFPVDGGQINGWLATAVTGTCVMMVAVGARFFHGAVTAIPARANSKVPLHLRLDEFRLLPGLPRRSIVVPFGNLELTSNVFRPPKVWSTKERLEREMEEEIQRKKQINQLLTLPFRQGGYWIAKGLSELWATFSTESHIFVFVTGKRGRWKLSKRPAWVLDEGRALDRLVRHKVRGI